jgi:riboflavin synthase
MFTGIVEETGEVVGVEDTSEGRRLRVAADEVGSEIDHGASISVSGVCLTVEAFGPVADLDVETDAGDTYFEVFVAAETAEVTYLDAVAVGDVVNLERALPADGRLDGHVVQGHVDTTAAVLSVERVGEDWRFAFAVPEGYGRFLADKGSVALDGISLTVAERREDAFEVAIIPTTYELTNLSAKDPGDEGHLEVDVLARYAERLLAEEGEERVPVAGAEPGDVRGSD